MSTYFIIGIVHPERALLTYKTSQQIIGIGDINISILNNQLFCSLEESIEYSEDIYTLRNMLQNLIQEELSMIGYIYGNGYFVEIIRIINHEKGKDEVFGIDIPCIAQRNIHKINDIQSEILKVYKVYNENFEYAYYIRRCFSELNKAMRFPIDTGFHCYRAIESLRHYCGKKYEINEKKFPKQKGDKDNYLENHEWKKLCELTGSNKETTQSWREDFAFSARHGNHKNISDPQRQEIFLITWDIVDKFIDSQV